MSVVSSPVQLVILTFINYHSLPRRYHSSEYGYSKVDYVE